MVWGTFALVAVATPAGAEAIEDAEPFDRLTFKEGAELEVLQLDLPRRRGVRPPSSGDVLAKLREPVGQEVRIEWRFVEEITLFEQLLLQAAAEAIAEKDFGAAYRRLVRLEKIDPRWPGLEAGFQQLLRDEALAKFRGGENKHALALLGSLYERAPSARGLASAVDAVGDSVLSELWDQEDYRAVSATYRLLDEQFDNLRLKTPTEWSNRLGGRQQSLLSAAADALRNGDMTDARRQALAAEALQPLDQAGRRLLAEIRRADPTIRVGVFRQAPTSTLERRVDRPASRRVGRLTNDALVWLNDYQSRGGVYGTPLGRVEVSDDSRTITMSLANEISSVTPDAAHRIARNLLSIPTQSFGTFGPLTQLIATVRVDDTDRVTVTLRTPHLRAESLLLGPMPAELSTLTPSRWEKGDDGTTTTYTLRDQSRGRFRLFEVSYEDDEEAVRALARGEIDVLADVPPWRLNALRGMSKVRVGQYRIPTVHCLVVGKNSRLATSREARRAITYALPRDYVVDQLILGGRAANGYQALSAPLPAGIALSDPLRYGYSSSIAVRPFRPRLAALLNAVSVNMTRKAEEDDALPTEPPPLRLAYPPSPIATLVCRTIADQFTSMGKPLELVPVADEAELTTDDSYDLRYAEVRIDEPMVQAWELLGPGGVAADCSAALMTALERVPLATTGEELSDRMAEVHQIAHGDLQIIPLMQTVDHYAWRTSVPSIPNETVDLYQTIAGWQRADTGAADD